MQIVPIIEHREGKPVYQGMWHQLVKVRDCLRPDGKYGTAEITGEADTFFSVPARMSIGGHKLRGFVTVDDFGKNVLPFSTSENLARLVEAQRNNGWDLYVWTFYPYHHQDDSGA